ncbi:MAG: LysR substrate-binding domain-containing protein [Bosea sp. (in: a-proteobacteria)]|uniref:LysR substrate-binding domain-containing protein n=1 Tax=Bosea sp. (in: a-proteobacteria) TaxID=1871050 RepID=UPI0027363034|nr:LysR substrate-binding domain-containing protein [Bosea sp. (in: a-proteobacteria)]MDP3602527.1 LysR substrate-binding domain-containing protein [Bosea sp. (in: a-proteobacteria)]
MLAALDPEAVAAFLRTADLASFTRAAEALGTTQSLVSTRIRRLEERLGKILLQRHPRLVRLTAEGERFLPAARDLMAAQAKALTVFAVAPERIAIGISEQAVGAEIPAVLARLATAHPDFVIALRIEPSRALEAAFERGELDVAIIRRLAPGRSGEVLREDGFGWFAAPRLIRRPDEALPLVSLTPDCWLRQHGMAALDRAGLAWREAFIGGGMAAVQAAVAGGLGVSPLATRLAPAGTVDVGRDWGLPDLGTSCVVLRSQVATPRANAFVRELAAAFRAG